MAAAKSASLDEKYRSDMVGKGITVSGSSESCARTSSPSFDVRKRRGPCSLLTSTSYLWEPIEIGGCHVPPPVLVPRNDMDPRSVITVSLLFAPVLGCLVMLATTKWLSHRWAMAAVQRTTRVTSRLRRAGRRPPIA